MRPCISAYKSVVETHAAKFFWRKKFAKNAPFLMRKWIAITILCRILYPPWVAVHTKCARRAMMLTGCITRKDSATKNSLISPLYARAMPRFLSGKAFTCSMAWPLLRRHRNLPLCSVLNDMTHSIIDTACDLLPVSTKVPVSKPHLPASLVVALVTWSTVHFRPL